MQAYESGERRPIAALAAVGLNNHHRRRWLTIPLALAVLALMLVSPTAPVRAQGGLCDPTYALGQDGLPLDPAFISPLVTSGTVADFYGYDTTVMFGFAQTALAQVNTSLLFLHCDDTTGEISVVMVHGAGGSGSATFTFSDLPATAAWVVQDDTSDTFTGGAPPSQVAWRWGACCGDGGAIGVGLAADFAADGILITPEFMTGITTWQFLHGPDPQNLTVIPLGLAGPVMIGGSMQQACALPTRVDLLAGISDVGYLGPTLPVLDAIADVDDVVERIWIHDRFAGPGDLTWRVWAPLLPDAIQGFMKLEFGEAYFVIAKAATTWTFPTGALPPTPTSVGLVAGGNNVLYLGDDRPVESVLGVGVAALRVAQGSPIERIWRLDFRDLVMPWRLWAPQLPDLVQGFKTVEFGRVYFVIASEPLDWPFPPCDRGGEPN